VQYAQLLGQLLRLLKRHADGDASKAVIRTACAVVDAFHFPLPTGDEAEAALVAEEAEEPEQQQAVAQRKDSKARQQDGGMAAAANGRGAGEKTLAEGEPAAAEREQEEGGEGEEGEEEEEEEAGAPEEAAAGAGGGGAVPAREVYRLLSRRVVPELQAIMVDRDTVRAPVALAGDNGMLPCCFEGCQP
jgi:U3 small nucleolar RNA-associated protein 20